MIARVQDLRGIDNDARRDGKVYDSNFKTRMKGSGLWADLIKQRFDKACARMGFNQPRTPMDRVALDVTQFRPGLLSGQGDLF